MNEKTIAYDNEAVALSGNRLQPLTSYFHQDRRPDKFAGTALTGIQAYMGNAIPSLTGSVVFTDLSDKCPRYYRPYAAGISQKTISFIT